MNKDQSAAFDAMIGEILAQVPTTQENEDHILAIEGSMTAELEDEVFEGWISREEAETVLAAFHRRLHPLL